MRTDVTDNGMGNEHQSLSGMRLESWVPVRLRGIPLSSQCLLPQDSSTPFRKLL